MRKMILLLAAPLAIWISCSHDNSEWKGSIEVVDGIKRIHNASPGWRDNPKVKLEFIRILGDQKSSEEDDIFSKPWDVAEDSKGYIYVVDAGDSCVKKFSPEGNYVKSIGRQGQGPGDFGHIRYIETDRNDTLYVKDEMSHRIHAFTNNGAYIKSFPNFKFGEFQFMEPDRFLMWSYMYNPDEQQSCVMSIIRFDGEVLNRFCKSETYSIADKQEERDVSIDGNMIIFTTDEAENIYLAYKTQNKIEKYDNNLKRLFVADRKLNFELGYEMRSQYLDINRMYRATMPKFRDVAGAIQLDYKNRIWILAYKDHAEDYDEVSAKEIYILEIYSSDGFLLGLLPYPVDWEAGLTPDMKIFGNRLYLFNPSISPEIHEFRIVDLENKENPYGES